MPNSATTRVTLLRLFETALLCGLLPWGCVATERVDKSKDLSPTRPDTPVTEGPAPDAWEETTRHQGVVVYRRHRDGSTLPELRAVAEIDANLYEVLAVLHDAERHTDWIYRCVESTILERAVETEGILYSRTRGLPPVVADRDVVLRVRASKKPGGREILVEFEALKSHLKTEVAGVVRMPQLTGHYRLTAISESRTRVDYQVYADPGGWLFDWIKRVAVRALPLNTITGLRRQVMKTRGQYTSFVDAWKGAELKAPDPALPDPSR